MKDESEPCLKAFAIERPNGSIHPELFIEKHEASTFAEAKYKAKWSSIQRTHKLRIVKVTVQKEQWQ